jgi:hypothetical protein
MHLCRRGGIQDVRDPSSWYDGPEVSSGPRVGYSSYMFLNVNILTSHFVANTLTVFTVITAVTNVQC